MKENPLIIFVLSEWKPFVCVQMQTIAELQKNCDSNNDYLCEH